MIELWPHQERAIQLARDSYSRGKRWPLIVMPTGSGKTVTATAMALAHVNRSEGNRILWTAHREELVSQAYDALTAAGLSCGVVMANPTRPVNPHRPVQVASIQTMLARREFPRATLVVKDEAHHDVSNQWSQINQYYRLQGTYGLGLTATPVRSDGRALGDQFDDLLVPVTPKELVSLGVLVPCTLIAPERALQSNEIAQSPLGAYLEHAAGRKAIVFAGNIPAVESFVGEFTRAGIPTASVTGDMDLGLRRSRLEAFRRGELKVLVNVAVLTEGFDDPSTSCVILARSIRSIGLYLQTAGRGLRACVEEGKTDLVLIDLHGCSRGFGAPDEDREYSLEGEGISCKQLEKASERFCPVCGELIVGADVHEQCGVSRSLLAAPDVVNVKLVRYERMHAMTDEQKRAWFEKLKGIATTKKHSRWAPRMKYRGVMGVLPPKSWW